MGSAIFEFKDKYYLGQSDYSRVCIEIPNIGHIYFKNMTELDKFAKEAGFSYEFHSEYEATECDNLGIVTKRTPAKMYIMSHRVIDTGVYFNSLTELPPNAKKIVMHNYGPKATCYYVVDGLNILIFRPNNNIPELNRIY